MFSYLCVTMGHLRAYYERLTRLEEADWRCIAAHFHRRVFLKNEVITEQGETENFLTFIETGTVRFFVPREDNDITFSFALDHEFACAYDSFLTRQPSVYALQALSRTVTWQISKADVEKVYAQTIAGNYLGRMAAEQLFLAKSKRELELLRYTAAERYLHLFSEQPELIKRVPQKYLAAYIGITPQALSRIRRAIC